VKINGTYTDVAELLPASMKSGDMLADNPGQWMYHCHVADHITADMPSLYRCMRNRTLLRRSAISPLIRECDGIDAVP
jgi:hypothetical protein